MSVNLTDPTVPTLLSSLSVSFLHFAYAYSLPSSSWMKLLSILATVGSFTDDSCAPAAVVGEATGNSGMGRGICSLVGLIGGRGLLCVPTTIPLVGTIPTDSLKIPQIFK